VTTYLRDTNTVSYIAKGNSRAARARLEAAGDGDIVSISAMTEAELRYGLAKRPQAHSLHAAIEALLFKLRILPWGREEAAACGAIRAKLRLAGKALDGMDMLIAAHAMAVGAVLVTNDQAFQHVEDLAGSVNWATDL
jgi:tRNA(fMet)-specific endonuclease VapC